MNLSLGLQLYTLREQLANNFEKTLDAIALAGYTGVELAGLHQQKPERVKYLLDNLNLRPVAMHCDVITPEGLQRSLEEAVALNCPNLVCARCPPETFETERNIRLLAEQLNKAGQIINAHGRTLLYHNHDIELRKFNNQYALNILKEYLNPTIYFEIDVYLVSVAGADSIALIKSLANRVQMLHIKDGFISPSKPNTAVGDGKMNYPTILAALPPSITWLFVELETCNSEILESVIKSAQYLTKLTKS
ncbi:MAG: sugar phosphate isomerase/epimerase family protein [Tenuifilaceae bacterium]